MSCPTEGRAPTPPTSTWAPWRCCRSAGPTPFLTNSWPTWPKQEAGTCARSAPACCGCRGRASPTTLQARRPRCERRGIPTTLRLEDGGFFFFSCFSFTSRRQTIHLLLADFTMCISRACSLSGRPFRFNSLLSLILCSHHFWFAVSFPSSSLPSNLNKDQGTSWGGDASGTVLFQPVLTFDIFCSFFIPHVRLFYLSLPVFFHLGKCLCKTFTSSLSSGQVQGLLRPDVRVSACVHERKCMHEFACYLYCLYVTHLCLTGKPHNNSSSSSSAGSEPKEEVGFATIVEEQEEEEEEAAAAAVLVFLQSLTTLTHTFQLKKRSGNGGGVSRGMCSSFATLP